MSRSSVAEAAGRIRAALKARGWGPRQVSVRSRSYSMGSSIDVAILGLAVPFAEVARIAKEEERVDRDDRGEILSGGNRFVSVDHDPLALVSLAETILPEVEAALAAGGGRVLGAYHVTT